MTDVAVVFSEGQVISNETLESFGVRNQTVLLYEEGLQLLELRRAEVRPFAEELKHRGILPARAYRMMRVVTTFDRSVVLRLGWHAARLLVMLPSFQRDAIVRDIITARKVYTTRQLEAVVKAARERTYTSVALGPNGMPVGASAVALGHAQPAPVPLTEAERAENQKKGRVCRYCGRSVSKGRYCRSACAQRLARKLAKEAKRKS